MKVCRIHGEKAGNFCNECAAPLIEASAPPQSLIQNLMVNRGGKQCPACSYGLGQVQWLYCPACGVKLSWPKQ